MAADVAGLRIPSVDPWRGTFAGVGSVVLGCIFIAVLLESAIWVQQLLLKQLKKCEADSIKTFLWGRNMITSVGEH